MTPAEESAAARVMAEIAHKGDFPAAGVVIQRLREVVSRDDCTALDIAKVILNDPGLSSKILRLVNSAFYRQRSNPVSTITRAVILLGFQAIRDLTAGLLLIEEFARQGRSSQYVREGVCRALLAAMVAQSLAPKVGVPASEEAYLLGLFANVGNLWLAAFYPDEFESARNQAREKNVGLDHAVARHIGIGPQEIAAAVLDHWNFPVGYAQYFHNRNARGRLTTSSGSMDRLAIVVDLAAEYATTATEEGSRPAPALLERFQNLLGAGPEVFASVVKAAGAALREQAPMLGFMPLPGQAPARPAPSSKPHATGAKPPATAAGIRAGVADPSTAIADPSAAVAILAEVTTSMVDGSDLDHTLSMILEGVIRAGGFDLVVLAFADPERTALTPWFSCGGGAYEALASLTVPLRDGGGILAETVLTRTPRIVSASPPTVLGPVEGAAAAVANATYVTYPVVLHGDVAGVLLAVRGGGDAAGAGELPLIQLFCNQASLALARRVP